MIFTDTHLAGAFIIDLERRGDHRGFFARTFCEAEFAAHGLNTRIVQANLSSNYRRGTVRGLHFQFPPHAETKLVRCTRGAMLDVIVDLRPESPTYLQHVGVELTAENGRALYVPERFAHGYQALADDTDTFYQVGHAYTPAAEGGIAFDDPRLAIAWPLPPADVSDRDRQWQPLSEYEPLLRERMALSAVTGSRA